ncbi:zeta toxin family protein [Mucilaginibacter sp.]|uniref:zeta toxin family protein n=1 Tax=Mucilaginibacter sp. TaxID=1882438 RepID=UPI0032656B82
MVKPELIFISGCNAAGKSTFIRTRLNELEDFVVLMTDVYKSRTKEMAYQAISGGKSVLVETVFNDASFSLIVDAARDAGYRTSLIALFLDNPDQSFSRVASRIVKQNGLVISKGNVRINFNESFKNLAQYFFYFDRSDFIYTGLSGQNKLIMSFNKGGLLSYTASELSYPQKFAEYSYRKERLNEDAYNIITANQDFTK